METTAEVIGPVVRMCGNPACRGGARCPDAPASPLMGLVEQLPRDRFDDEALTEFFVQELLFSAASDSAGARHVIPDGMGFTVHKGSAGFHGADRLVRPGAEVFACLYSGPARNRDEALAEAPPYDDEYIPARRWHRALECGRFRNLERYGDPYDLLHGVS